jgi:hypothetical protein
MLGARRAGTGMYSNVHEDSEHRATTWPQASPQMGTAVVFNKLLATWPTAVDIDNLPRHIARCI